MLELCEMFSVYPTNSIPDGFIVEDCGEYDAALAGLSIVCRQHEISNVRDWIQNNTVSNVDHVLHTFDRAPERILKYVSSFKHVNSYTEEMVQDVGGIQAFLDKYAATPLAKQVSKDSKPVQAESEIPEFEPMDLPPINLSKSEPEDPILAGEMAARKSDEMTELFPSLENSSDMQIEKHVIPVQPTQPNPTTQAPVQRVVTEIVEVKKEVHNIQEYDPALIKDISDGDIAASLDHLRELNSQIALDGLNPDLVLSDSELDRAYTKLEAYPPTVFKGFILSLLSNVSTEVERFRVSSVLDDFATYVS